MTQVEQPDKPVAQKALSKALLEAQKIVEAVGKDSQNAFHKYSYASSEAIITEARRCLNEAGVLVRRGAWSLFMFEGQQMALMTFHVSHPESGESFTDNVEFPIVPDKGRPLDKALSAALTTAQSYYLRDLLLIPRVDEEVDKRDDTNHQPPKQVAPQQTNMVASQVEILQVKDLLVATGSDAEAFMAHLGIKDLDKMSKAQAQTGLALLRKKKRQQDGEDGVA